MPCRQRSTDWEDILANDARVLEHRQERAAGDARAGLATSAAPRSRPSAARWTSRTSSPRSSASIPSPRHGYIKRQLKATYQAQKRGGRGISGMTRREEDIVQEMFVGSTHDYVLFCHR